ncbi:M23 family metallopeptidase [Pseudolysinimonas sp.]|uniref:M23 family metallopeptidase n=1 Tax=Pseudolysinimonas sp. TaxID=2680009 RepID=UPI00286C4D15|nr:M23 family metallopeptidase [Pseudolysinimonas sp.]
MAGVCLAAVGTLTVPAAVAAIQQAQIDATAQSFELSASWATAAAVLEPERDQFDITEYTVVQWPLAANTTISSFFGYRSCEGCSTMHSGIDFTPGAGVPIEAIADGVVVGSSVADGSWGVHVTIEHNVDGVIYRSAYAHMQSGSMTLEIGDTVERGQVIGRVGNTGQSFGAHLHFVIQTGDGTFINPLPWMREHVNIAE